MNFTGLPTIKKTGRFLSLWCVMALLLFAGCNTKSEEGPKQPPHTAEPAAIEKRDEAMRQLAGETKTVLQALKGLDAKEKDAVVALVALTKAVEKYEAMRLSKDATVVGAYYKDLSNYSDRFNLLAEFRSAIMGCFNASVSCLSARKKCLDEGRTEAQCDRDPKVIEPCANEAACIAGAFLKLKKGLPDILGGRNPWPPQPFPF